MKWDYSIKAEQYAKQAKNPQDIKYGTQMMQNSTAHTTKYSLVKIYQSLSLISSTSFAGLD